MIKQITKVNPNTGKEYVGEIIVDTIGSRGEVTSSYDFFNTKSEYVITYNVQATVNGVKVYSQSTVKKDKLLELADSAEKSILVNIMLLMEEEQKGSIEEELEKLGFKNNLEY